MQCVYTVCLWYFDSRSLLMEEILVVIWYKCSLLSSFYFYYRKWLLLKLRFSNRCGVDVVFKFIACIYVLFESRVMFSLAKRNVLLYWSATKFSIPFLTAVQSYRPHSEGKDPIWGDDWSHSLHSWSPSWSSLGFSSAVRQMPGDLCTAPGIISLSSYH